MRGAVTSYDPEADGPLLFEKTVLVAIDAMLDARRADAYRKRAAETDEPGERQWLNEAADAAIAVAHQKALTVCAEAKAAAVDPLQLAYMRSRLPPPGPWALILASLRLTITPGERRWGGNPAESSPAHNGAMRFLLPAVLAVALLTGSAWAQTSTIKGAGTASCGTWTAMRQVRQALAYEQWVQGYLSGVGNATYQKELNGDDPLRELDESGVLAWFDNYCGTHPLERIVGAAHAFILARRARPH